ncbi:hypothetical protein EMCRGX_G002039 [Ephydatia muelleri]
MQLAVLLIALVAMVQADMYLHNPRGSNDRLDEANRERDNANRLFDSQNNNRGGYNVGSLYYYAGSIVPVEWTNQHSCADQNANCQIIFQYMCGELVRDGASTNTIPDNPLLCQNSNCTTDLKFGMHEPYSYYLDCKLRSRNKGLFLADRNLQGTSATFTRQNEAGTRRGYECPEERDYYPYWHPTPWVDIAVLTNNISQCSYYQTESANVKSRYACVNYTTTTIPNNAADCVNVGRGMWKEFPPTPGLSAPDCTDALWSRDNQLGNGVEFPGYPNYYNWTVPNTPAENCVFRVRYNISTGEYNGWNSAINGSIARVTKTGVLTNNINAQATTATNPTIRQTAQAISSLDVSSYLGFGLNTTEQYRRGYVFRQNPTVMPFYDVPGFGLQLAINTNQFGRTFQDRSHTFAIKAVPDNLKGATIYNLNVRGKRGNIVQVYPGVEYDFVPDVLVASVNSYIHVQWTGSNTNPQDNAGQGQAGTDRSNMVLLRSPNYPEGNGQAGPSNGHWGNNYPAHLDSNQTLLGWSRVDRQALAVLDNVQRGGEMSELDDAGTYFDLGPKQVTQVGTYYYLCTRNNNFSNRDQKSKIIVQSNPYSNARVGALGGFVTVSSNMISFPPAALTSPVTVQVEVFQNASGAQAITNSPNTPDYTVSAFTWVGPQQFPDVQGSAVIQLALSGTGPNVQVYRANEASGWVYQALDTAVANGMASAQTNSGGMFVAASSKTAIISVATVLVIIVVLATVITVSLVVYFKVKKGAWQNFKTAVKNVPKLRRHVAGKV